MMRALYTAATGMQAQQRNIAVLKKAKSSFRIYCITMNAALVFLLQFPLRFQLEFTWVMVLSL